MAKLTLRNLPDTVLQARATLQRRKATWLFLICIVLSVLSQVVAAPTVVPGLMLAQHIAVIALSSLALLICLALVIVKRSSGLGIAALLTLPATLHALKSALKLAAQTV